MTHSFAPDTVVRLRGDALAWRKVADDVVVLNSTSNEYHAINATGSVLWESLAEGATVGRLTELLADAFPKAAGRAAQDIDDFLGQLAERGMLDSTPAAQP